MKPKEPHSILVVDDNEQALKLVEQALNTRGFRVQTTPKGLEALTILEKTPADLVIIDLVMPDIDGMELATKILHQCPEIRILVMSGYADDVVVHGVFKSDKVDFLSKPFSIRDLFARVNALLKL